MLVVVIVAHPCADSFTQSLTTRAVAGLHAARHDVEVIDLYAIGFRAAMSDQERQAYHSGQPILDPVVEQHADVVRRADALVFIYPTWWSGLPAVLKGWIERVMVPGVGFVFNERSGKVRPGLTNVKTIVGVSTYGSPRSAVRVVNDNGRRTIMRAFRMSCGLRVRTRWHALYAIDTSTPAQRDDFASCVERSMAAL